MEERRRNPILKCKALKTLEANNQARITKIWV